MADGDAAMGGNMLTDWLRSYMFNIETRETLWLDRLDNPWAEEIARVLEKVFVETPAVASVVISGEYVALKVAKDRRVEVWRDGAVVIKVPDCVLIADDKFLLLCMNEDGLYVPVAKSETITWEGTEEYFAPIDIYRNVKQTLKRVLERARWI